MAFDVALHLGTLLALLVFFRSDVVKYLRAWFQSLAKWNLKENLDQRLAWYLLISTIPAVITGFFLENIIETLLRAPYIVVGNLILFGLLFFLVEKLSKKESGLASLTWLKTLLIGVAQAVALIPGVSRSGITIIAGMSFKLKREVAARFSFLMAIPVVFGAGAKEGLGLISEGLPSSELGLYLIGTVSPVLVGFFCIKYFLQFLKKYFLNVFGAYRIVLGIILLVYLIFKLIAR